MREAVLLLSGGLDSVTLAHRLKEQDMFCFCLTFDYGQTHSKEAWYARKTAEKLGWVHRVLKLRIRGESALLGNLPIPQNAQPGDSVQSATVVPNRNGRMILAAAAEYCLDVYIGCNAGDAAVYPDCRAEYLGNLDMALQSTIGTRLHYPFVSHTKQNIIAEAVHRYGITSNDYWSCYVGGDVPCGKCGPCVAIGGAV